jgi:hypothetical protein
MSAQSLLRHQLSGYFILTLVLTTFRELHMD